MQTTSHERTTNSLVSRFAELSDKSIAYPDAPQRRLADTVLWNFHQRSPGSALKSSTARSSVHFASFDTRKSSLHALRLFGEVLKRLVAIEFDRILIIEERVTSC